MLQSRYLTWRGSEPAVYLTFDDGPHPKATPFILDELAKVDAKGTFFCLGKNVEQHPDIYQRILDEGHAVGNHTHDHLNGWNTKTESYIESVSAAEQHIKSRLFRPPYGRITRAQAAKLAKASPPFRIIMWDVISADFDERITPDKCLDNVIKHTQPGSIVVFHDSTKAWERMSFALPRALKFFKEKGWKMNLRLCL